MDDQYFMELALRLAQERKGLTHPNPTVGCVIVKEGKVIAQANHERAGLPHAEAKALSIAGESAKGSTLYVTLEPCTHFGRTPPCVDAIIKAGVKRVVIATLDPNPLVSGKGVQRLKEAGIEVKVGVLEEEAKRLNEDFFTYITKRRPYITLKFAQSLDGSLATKDYHSKWISSEESRKYAHRLRAEASAVLVGINTVLRDNPSLTVRAFEWERNPTRIVLDPRLRIPMDCNLVKDKKAKTIVITAMEDKEKIDALQEEGVEVLLAEYRDGLLNLREVLRELYFKEVMHLLVEGGARTLTSFIREGFYDRVCIFLAPIFIGEGVRLGDLGIKRVEDAIRLKRRELKFFDGDIYLEMVRE
ncbi:MAG: bifunctional diaminohydroxyphosphoribosylaminopyrimidine deaminase/5-amino-6-(5-phosphoribosylamino)uracil reductase RibD [Thermocrinis sp.]|jgi:diaminohydroxyphosphoribosylaminopyrimidine deaminase/5-amino-6-(5-phosphoribosylamino)uracil reductase|uniref:bifunctional diaminohydroxyphosphoribosylaminopyrimidine deaminase/5-amino-6-(5-phosphoribosylamino)uracil reductase RibD n=1 Tax=Thermocrinis sp. TaxID=2024383 RepID=UPI003C01C187